MFSYRLGIYLKLHNPTSEKITVKTVSMVTNTKHFFTDCQIFISVRKEILLRERINVQLGLEQVHLCKYKKRKWCAALNMKVPYQISPRWQVNVDPQQHIVHTEATPINIHISQTYCFGQHQHHVLLNFFLRSGRTPKDLEHYPAS